MKEQRLWDLVSLKLSGEASVDDLEELDSITNQHPELHFKISLLQDFWKSNNASNTNNVDHSFDRHLQRLSNHLTAPALQYEESKEILEVDLSEPSSISKKFFWISGIAASLIIVIAAYFVVKPFRIAPLPAENIVATKSGSKTKITLPDGTQVWLNSESKITYNEKFGQSIREVKLTGEAYFDVVKDKTKPFIIHTNTIDVKVIGTAFNVRSYPNEKTVETSLIRGIVEVTVRNSPDKKIILKPKEKLVVQNEPKKDNKESNEVKINNEPLLILTNLHFLKGDSSAVETSWIKNRLAFDGESLDEVTGKIEKWYGVKILIDNEKLKEGEYTGVFEDENLTEVMEALKLTGNFNYKFNKKQVIISQ